MRKLCLFILMCFFCLGAFSQEITLSFIGQLNNSEYCPMDSVVVTNVTRNWTESVVYPDTIIVVGGTVGNNLNIVTNMGLEQNVPNPFDCETRVELAVLHREDVRMQLLDITGHVCAEYTGSLNEGVHVFDISAANPQTYILNAIIGSRSYSIRMVNVGSGCGCSIKYSGLGKGIVRKFETANEFELGDDMQYVGYATVDGDLVVSDTVEQSLTESQCVTLHFTRSLPHVETLAASSVTNLSAILHGRITGTGGSSIIACGFYYGTSEDDLSQNVTATLTDNVFSYELADLTFGTTYYYKAYAINNVGTSYGEVRLFTTDNSLNGHDFVDLGLPSGTLWATCNVGANNPEDYGDYFAWGETAPKSDYSTSTYIFYFENSMTKYNSTDSLVFLESIDDAATANWGEGWRMPTIDEYHELMDNCTHTWTTINGVNCFVFIGPNGNSIILPATGLRTGSSAPVVGSRGCYWSNSLYGSTSNFAWDLYFWSTNFYYNDSYTRDYGLSVRAVRATAPVISTQRAIDAFDTSVVLGGNVTFDGGAVVTERGFVYGTNADNLTENVQCGSGSGRFTATLTGLAIGTTYYFKAYAVNSEGTSFGEVKSFIAGHDINMADGLTINVDCGQTYYFYDSGGVNGEYGNNEEMTARFESTGRITLSLSYIRIEQMPGLYNADSIYVYDGDADTGTILINDLNHYYGNSSVTAYSGIMTVVWHSNGSDTRDGWEAIITADCEPAMPIAATLLATNVTETSATLNGKIIYDGEIPISSCGFYYGTSEDSLSQNVTATLTENRFSYELTGLTPGTTYYYQAYTTNSLGTGYGEIRYFIAIDGICMADGIDMDLECGHTYNFYDSRGPDGGYDNDENMTARFVSSGRITLSFSDFSATGTRYDDYMYVYDGEVDSGNVLIEGFCGNVVPSPVTAYSGIMTVFWRSNGSVTRDGWEAIITADCEPAMPEVATLVVTNITDTSATLNGNVTSDCGAIVTSRGFYYGISEDDLSQYVTATLTDNGFSSELTGLTPGTTYYYKAYATNSVGTGYGEVKRFSTSGLLNGHYFVDLGLPSGRLWATCNVGSDILEGYGEYFAWGETTPKEIYSWNTYIYSNGYSNFTKYCNDPSYGYNGFTDTLSILQPSDDAATANWGEGWRMPTKKEVEELYMYCTMNVTTINGVSGWIATGPSGNSIFLPAAGYHNDPYIYQRDSTPVGEYWTSTLSYHDNAEQLHFDDDFMSCGANTRFMGASVRALCISVPDVSTIRANYVIETSAILIGSVTFDGGAIVTERGFVYGTNADNLTESVQCGSGWSSFSASLTGLTPGTNYFYKAYAINSQGIDYGEVKSFTTATSPTPDIIMDDGLAFNIACGHTYNFYDSGGHDFESDVYKNMTARFESTGRITLSFSSIDAGMYAYMYVYDGESGSDSLLINWEYGNDVPTTVTAYSGTMTIVCYSGVHCDWEAIISAACEPAMPAAATLIATNITEISATLNGNVISDCGAIVTGSGFYYGTSEDNLSQNVTASFTDNGFSYELTGLDVGTTYYYRAYVVNREGVGCGEIRSFTTMLYSTSTGYVDGYGYVDLGLPSGTLWATCNIGANRPEEYGDLFAWGETTPKETYTWSNYQYCNGGASTLTKYSNSSSDGYNGFVDNLTILEPSDDAATVNMGINWSMPTNDEIHELYDNCTHDSVTQNGVKGILFTGPNGNSIFLPAKFSYYNNRMYGCYWSSSLFVDASNYAMNLYFESDGYVAIFDTYDLRYYGLSVRAVCSPGQN